MWALTFLSLWQVWREDRRESKRKKSDADFLYRTDQKASTHLPCRP
jgi:hypothetical protein